MLHEHTTSDRINRLLVQFFDVLDVRADRDLVGGHEQTCVWENTKVAHLLDCLSDLAMGACGKARLVAVVNLASLVQELAQKRRVLPFDVFLRDGPHIAFADLTTGHWSVQEGCRLLHLVVELLVLFIDNIASSEVAISLNKRSSVSIFLSVLPGRG